MPNSGIKYSVTLSDAIPAPSKSKKYRMPAFFVKCKEVVYIAPTGKDISSMEIKNSVPAIE